MCNLAGSIPTETQKTDQPSGPACTVRLDVFSSEPLASNPAAAGYLLRLVGDAFARLESPRAEIPQTFEMRVSMNRLAAQTGHSKPTIGGWLRCLHDCELLDFSAGKAGTDITLKLDRILAK